MSQPLGRIIAVLGPTNTGKTHYAIERMLALSVTGIIGLPLRLLAREVYDRIVALRGPSVVALVTGEERIVPAHARNIGSAQPRRCPMVWVPTFLADRRDPACAPTLSAGTFLPTGFCTRRGLHETLFLGSDAMRSGHSRPGSQSRSFYGASDFPSLTYTQARRKSAGCRARAAIVGFSVDNVYALAELLRRQKGGAAVVMGALSPRTRNAQVANCTRTAMSIIWWRRMQ